MGNLYFSFFSLQIEMIPFYFCYTFLVRKTIKKKSHKK